MNSGLHHSFDVKLATQLGSIELAIVVHHFQYWINHNSRLNRNFKEGRYWTYQTREEIKAHFPYWSTDQIRRYTDKLVKMKILRKGNFNKFSMDKTIWYAFENPEMFTMGESAKSIDESASLIDDSAKAIPHSIPKSKTKYNKDLGIETEACKKKQEKNLDAPRRWKLTEEQTETFHLLKSFDIDTTEAKLCYWAKTYDAQRLIDVYNESKHNGARSLRKYMSKLLDEKKVVQNANIEANIQFAKDFMKENKWYGPKIYKKYMKIPLGQDWIEIDLNMNSRDFINRLMEKYDNCRQVEE